MDKKWLLELVNSLPEDVEAEPFDYKESTHTAGDWEFQRMRPFVGVYRQTVDNHLTVRLHFKTTYEGEFRRTYTDPAGSFLNLHRVG